MYVSFPLLSILFFLGVAQAVFLALVYVRTASGNRTARRLMVALLGALALSICNGLLYQTNLYQDMAWLIGIPQIFQLMVGPVFFLYFRSLTIKDFKLRFRDAAHMIPALAYLLFNLSFLSEGPLYKMVLMYSWLHHERGIREYLSRFWFEFLIPLQPGLYLAWVWRGIRQHEKRIRDNFSTIDGVTLSWLWRVVAAFSVGLAGAVLGYALLFFGVQLDWTYVFAPLANTVVVYYLAWVSISKGVATGMVKLETRSPQGGDPQDSQDSSLSNFPPGPVHLPGPRLSSGPKYQNNALPEEYCRQLVTRLENEMRSNRPYLDPELTLTALAEHIRTSRNHLSQILNQYLKTSFYDYINRFRIKEAAVLLVHPDYAHAEIMRIALDAGFNIKSTFNKAFKTWYGVSPSEYRRGIRIPPLSWVEGDRGVRSGIRKQG